MKFTLSWLKDFIDFKDDVSVDQISETLTAIGLEIEGVENRSADFADFKVCYVEDAAQHPDADKLKVCKVNTGEGVVQVVCGAPNARTGMKGVFAPSGSYVPGIDMVLKPAKLRGVESNGMLVSEREMTLSDDHDGIIDVAEDIEVGTPIAELYPQLNEVVFEIGLTPNRPDCAGIYGIARDLAAAGLGTFKPVSQNPIEGQFESPIKSHIHNEDACPVILARYFKGIKNGESPDWLKEKLEDIGVKPISAIVDITNFMSYGYCRPLHAFDADNLKGDLQVHLAKGGEQLVLLNNKNYTFKEGTTVISDDTGVLELSAIMGGKDSGCSEETTNALLISAYFDPVRTARTGRDLGIISDARYRFERGIDPAFTPVGMEVASQMILDLCGGEASHVTQAGTIPDDTHDVVLRLNRVQTLGGIEIDAKDQEKILNDLGFETVFKDTETLTVKTPSWRPDIVGEADLVEEIIRIHGYDAVEAVTLPRADYMTPNAETPDVAMARKLRTSLAARGLQEAVTWSFMDKVLAKDFTSNDNAELEAVTLLNPISEDLSTMRPSILPNLIQAAAKNADKGFSNTALFEVGPVFHGKSETQQPVIACGIRFGAQADKHWSNANLSAVTCFDAKADALDALNAAGAPTSVQIKSDDLPDYFHPGRSGAICLGKNVLAYFGEIHPLILQKLDISDAVVGFEVFPQNLPPQKKKSASKKLLEISPLMPLKRDFAFIVEDKVSADDVMRAVMAADKKLISDVSLFDEYRGKGVEDGHKSLALSVTLQPVEKTLTDEEIENISKSIIETVAKKTGGSLR